MDSARLHHSIEAALREALAGAYGVTGLSIVADGEVHRFDAPDKKRGNLSGWYVVPSHEVAIFGCWHLNDKHTATLAGEHNPIAAEQARQAAAHAYRERQQQRDREQAQAARKARQWWREARQTEAHHPYLNAKRVRPHGLRQRGPLLLVPLFCDGVLVNLQRIDAAGNKRFMAGARIKGVAALVGCMAGAERVYLCEGWATAATIHEQSGHPVVAAMNCGNLAPVSKALRQRLPAEVAITIAADNDRCTDGNPGLTMARQVAYGIGADLVWPRFPCTGCGCTDFNDLAGCERQREVSK